MVEQLGTMGAITDLRCDRCNERANTLYLSKDLSAKNVEIIGLPWYCGFCMKETGQELSGMRMTVCWSSLPLWDRRLRY